MPVQDPTKSPRHPRPTLGELRLGRSHVFRCFLATYFFFRSLSCPLLLLGCSSTQAGMSLCFIIAAPLMSHPDQPLPMLTLLKGCLYASLPDSSLLSLGPPLIYLHGSTPRMDFRESVPGRDQGVMIIDLLICPCNSTLLVTFASSWCTVCLCVL